MRSGSGKVKLDSIFCTHVVDISILPSFSSVLYVQTKPMLVDNHHAIINGYLRVKKTHTLGSPKKGNGDQSDIFIFIVCPPKPRLKLDMIDRLYFKIYNLQA